MAIFTKLLSNYDNNSSKYTGCSTGNYRGQYFQNYQTLELFALVPLYLKYLYIWGTRSCYQLHYFNHPVYYYTFCLYLRWYHKSEITSFLDVDASTQKY